MKDTLSTLVPCQQPSRLRGLSDHTHTKIGYCSDFYAARYRWQHKTRVERRTVFSIILEARKRQQSVKQSAQHEKAKCFHVLVPRLGELQ